MGREPDTDNAASGWNAIAGALGAVYTGQEPKHYGTLRPYALGGRDPIRGISIYRAGPPDHWHYVTYGFSELFEKEARRARSCESSGERCFPAHSPVGTIRVAGRRARITHRHRPIGAGPPNLRAVPRAPPWRCRPGWRGRVAAASRPPAEAVRRAGGARTTGPPARPRARGSGGSAAAARCATGRPRALHCPPRQRRRSTPVARGSRAQA
jgi:Suppressor of fused protein (SUFU)